MAITLVSAAGAFGSGTTSASSAFPAGAATDIILALIGGKPFGTTPANASYTIIDAIVNSGSVANSNGAGSVVAAAFSRNSSPTGASSDSFTFASGSPCMAQGIRFAGATNTLAVTGTGLADTTETGTAVSATGTATAGEYASGDLVVVNVIINDDVPTHTSQTLTIAGCTVGAVTWLARSTTTSGFDGAQYVGYATITAGSSSGTCTYAATSNTSGASGTAVNLVGLREVLSGTASVAPAVAITATGVLGFSRTASVAPAVAITATGALGLSTGASVPNMGTAVPATAGDGYGQTGFFSASSIYTGVEPGGELSGFWRMPLSIPQGTTLTSATFTVNLVGVFGAPYNLKIRAIASDDAPAVTAATDIVGPTRTTAFLNWTAPLSIGDISHDVTAIVQEIVNRAGWVSGNSIMFVTDTNISDNGSTTAEIQIRDYASSASLAGRLVVATSIGVAITAAGTVSAAAGTYSGTASVAAAVSVTATGAVGTSATASVAPAVSVTATGVVASGSTASVAPAVGVTSTGVVNLSTTASVSAAVGATATGVAGVVTSGSVSPAVAVTATGASGVVTSGSVSPAVAVTATGAVGTSTSATVSAATAITTTGAVGAVTSATVSETTTVTATGTMAASGSASVAPSVSVTADGDLGGVLDPSIRAIGTAVVGNVTSTSPTVPATAEVGDLLLRIEVGGNNALTGPGGDWVLKSSLIEGASSQISHYVWSKVCASADIGATVTVTSSLVNRKYGLVVVVQDAGPVDQSVPLGDSTSLVSSRTAASSTNTARDFPILIASDRANASTAASSSWTWPTAYTGVHAGRGSANVNTGEVSLGIATHSAQASGATAGGGTYVAENTLSRAISTIITVKLETATAYVSPTVTVTSGGVVTAVSTASVAEATTITASSVVGKLTTASVSPAVAVTATGAVGSSGTASVSPAATISATGAVGSSGTASVAETTTITATSAVGKVTTASVSAAVAITAAGILGTATSASVASVVSVTSTGFVARSTSASVDPVVAVTATGATGTSTSASIAPAVAITASGAVGLSSTASVSITTTISGDGTAAVTGVSSSAPVSVAVAVSASGSITSTASVAPTVALTGTGALGLSTGAYVPSVGTAVPSTAGDGYAVTGFFSASSIYTGVEPGIEPTGFWRMPLTVAQGTTVTWAALTLNVQGIFGGTANLKVRALASDNAPAVTADTDVVGPARSTAFATFAPTDFGDWSIDVTAVVQEIVSRAGWVSGNSITFVTDSNIADNGSTTAEIQVRDYSSSAALAGRLVVATTIGVTVSAAGVLGATTSASVAPVTSVTSTGVVARSTTASVAPAVGVTATGATGVSTSASVSPSVTVTAAGVVGATSTASVAATTTVTAAGVLGSATTASVSVAVAVSAAGVLGTVTSASVSASVAVSADGTTVATNSASVSSAVSVTATGLVGSATSASVSPSVAVTATGAVGLFGSRVQLINDLDGTAGQTFTNYLGAPNAFNTTVSAANVSYDTSVFYQGTASAHLVTTTAAAGAGVYSGTTLLGTGGLGNPLVWFKAYFRIGAATASNVNLLNALSNRGDVSLTPSRTLTLGATSSAMATSTTVIPLSTWVRLEFDVVGHVSAGSMTLRIYLTPTATVPDETLAVTGMSTGLITNARVGSSSSVANTDYWFDGITVDTIMPPSVSSAVARTATGALGKTTTASVAPAVAITAAGVVTAAVTASVDVAVAVTATGVVALSTTASVAPVVAVTGTGAVGLSTSASVSSTISVTAAGLVGSTATASVALAVAVTATGVVGLSTSASPASTSTAIASSPADGYAQTGYFSAGSIYTGVEPGLELTGFWRMTLAVGPSAFIAAATLTLNAQNLYGATPNLKVSALASDNSSAVAADTDVIGPTRTTASTNWLPTSPGDWALDVTSVVQEVVNRAGWVSGNSLTFVTDTNIANNGSTTAEVQVTDYSTTPALAGRLAVAGGVSVAITAAGTVTTLVSTSAAVAISVSTTATGVVTGGFSGWGIPI